MPLEKTTPEDNGIETPRGPQGTGGIPDRKQEDGIVPPIVKPADSKNPNDPPLPRVSPVRTVGDI